MKNYRVNINEPEITYNTTGFSSEISKDFEVIETEIDVFYDDLVSDKDTQGIELPVTIFSQELSALQAIVKHLKETEKLSFSEIADILNRDPRTIWTTYDAVKDAKLKKIKADVYIPLSIFGKTRT